MLAPLIYSRAISDISLSSSSFERALQRVVCLDRESGRLFTERFTYAGASNLSISECTFSKCGSDGINGGALYISSKCNVELTETGFADCVGSKGGCIFSESVNEFSMNGCCISGARGSVNSIMYIKGSGDIKIQQTYVSDCRASSDSSCFIKGEGVEISDSSFTGNDAGASSLLSVHNFKVLRNCFFGENKGNVLVDIVSEQNSAGQIIRFEKNSAKFIFKNEASNDLVFIKTYIINDNSEMIAKSGVGFREGVFSDTEEEVKRKLNTEILSTDNTFGTRDAPTINVKPSNQCWKYLPTPNNGYSKFTTGQKVAVALLVIFVFIIALFLIKKFVCKKDGGMEPLRYTV